MSSAISFLNQIRSRNLFYQNRTIKPKFIIRAEIRNQEPKLISFSAVGGGIDKNKSCFVDELGRNWDFVDQIRPAIQLGSEEHRTFCFAYGLRCRPVKNEKANDENAIDSNLSAPIIKLRCRYHRAADCRYRMLLVPVQAKRANKSGEKPINHFVYQRGGAHVCFFDPFAGFYL